MSDKRLESYYKLKERVLQLKAKLQAAEDNAHELQVCFDEMSPKIKALEADSKVQKKIRNDIIAAHKILTDMLEVEIKELKPNLTKHKKAIKIALDFISPEGDCVEQSKRLEIEQALKGD